MDYFIDSFSSFLFYFLPSTSTVKYSWDSFRYGKLLGSYNIIPSFVSNFLLGVLYLKVGCSQVIQFYQQYSRFFSFTFWQLFDRDNRFILYIITICIFFSLSNTFTRHFYGIIMDFWHSSQILDIGCLNYLAFIWSNS